MGHPEHHRRLLAVRHRRHRLRNRSTSLVASGQIGAATEASRKALRWMIASFLTLPLCLALMIGYALIARGMA